MHDLTECVHFGADDNALIGSRKPEKIEEAHTSLRKKDCVFLVISRVYRVSRARKKSMENRERWE